MVYFGGDVQTYERDMLSHRDNHRHAQWSLERTAGLLRGAFPSSIVAVVRPARMRLDTFSCYENFVPSDSFTGAPDHCDNHEAVKHLRMLLASVVPAGTEVVPVVLVGFSKGVVVLNQLVHEFSFEGLGQEEKEFIK